jgi:hypothetical protein
MRTKLEGFPDRLAPGPHPAKVSGITADRDGKLTMVLTPAGPVVSARNTEPNEDIVAFVADAICELLRSKSIEYEDVEVVYESDKHMAIIGATEIDALPSLSISVSITE